MQLFFGSVVARFKGIT